MAEKISRRDFLVGTAGSVLLSSVAGGALLPPDFLQCVVSIGSDDLVNEGGTPVIRWVSSASGLLYGAAVPKTGDEEQQYWVYLVTSKHVLTGQPQINVRFNSLSGNATKYPIPLTGPDSAAIFAHPVVDLAAVRLNAGTLQKDGIEFKFFVSADLATRETIAGEGIAVGDGVFVLGFPMGLTGTERNFVVAKQGIIARLTATQDPKLTKEYLIDALIFPGNSGGPVVTRVEAAAIGHTKAVKRSYLLGMVYQFLPYTDVAFSRQTNRPRITFEENSGLASVIPADYIEEAIQMHIKVLGTAGPKAK
jgi:S1-C subfamily serine protease